MASFTQDELNLILSRGFKGSPFPLVPVMTRYVRGDIDYFTPVGQVQNLYLIGTCQQLADGVYVIDDDIWKTDEITTEDYYNTFNGINLGVQGNVVTIKYMHDNTQLSPPTSITEFTDDVHLGATHVLKTGNVYLCLAYNPNRGVIDFALHFEAYVNVSVAPVQVLGTDIIEFVSVQQWEDNQPWHYLLTQGDPTWYDTESQVPESTEGGGGGGFYRASDTIGFSGLPALDILDFGCVSLYKMNTTNMRALSSFLWSNDFFDNIIKNWQSPFDNIISIGFVPLNSELTGVDTNISIGNVPTDITATKLLKSVIEKDFGRVNFKELYNNFADYAPFTKLQIYLPSVGVKDLNPDDYMDGALHLMCYVDCLSGTCVYQLKSIRHGREHVVDNYTGNVLTAIPITGRNFIDAYKGVMNGLSSVASGNIGGLVSSAFDIKPTYQKTGSVSGSSTRLSVHTPYIFFDTAQLRQPKYFREQHGYVSNQTKRLGDCTGYNEILYIDIDDLTAIDSEKDEILSLLKSGVYV